MYNDETIMAAGLISDDAFDVALEHFFALSESFRDDWELKKSKNGEKYISKKLYKTVQRAREEKNKNLEPDNDEMTVFDGCNMEECASPSSQDETEHITLEESDSTETLMFEYHVVYSKSYSVPVLFFNVHRSDGSLLKLDELWEMVPSPYYQRLQIDKWSFLTQQEHPLLGRPFFTLHPCHTGEMMAPVMQVEKSYKNYLVTWLSCIGPVVGLHLPLSYGNMVT